MDTPQGMNWIEYAKLAISLITLASIVLAFLSYRTNTKKINEDRVRDRDKELISQTQKSLQWAYDVLTENGKNFPPKADRLNWLTSARHILRAEKLSSQITSETYTIIFKEIEEFWRHQFYVALNHKALAQWTYFSNDNPLLSGEILEPKSVLVVAKFSEWKEGQEDPIDSVDLSLPERGLSGYIRIGLPQYLSEIEAFRKRYKQNVSPVANSSS